MKIAIISDIHNNLVNLKKVLDYCAKEKIIIIICCGDLASLETLDFLNDNFDGKIYNTFGNMDNDYLKEFPFECHSEWNGAELKNLESLDKHEMTYEYKNTKIYKNYGEAEIGGYKISFVHYPEKANDLCRTGKYDFVFYGHTHKPWDEVINNCRMLNPGNVAGEIYPPTFAVWETDTNKFDLIKIHQLQ